MGPRGARHAAIVTVLVLALAPVVRLACAAACAAPRATTAAFHIHCTSGTETAAAGDARLLPDDRSGCTDAHAIAGTQSARVGTDDVLAIVSRPEPVSPVLVPLDPGHRQPPPIGPPGYDGHARPLRI